MKKIGIITVYKNINYGSKLQSFALQKTIKTLGYFPENIDFYKKENESNYWSGKKKLIKGPADLFTLLLRKIFDGSKRKKRVEIFNDFLEKNIIYNEYKKENFNEQEFYKFICGSDQIWAPNQFNSDFFLGFVKDKNKKIAYAPSIGLPVIPMELQKEYKELIKNIEAISIREEDGAKIVENLTERKVQVVLDPTLLLDRYEWKNALQLEEKKIKEKYILCYFLGENKEQRLYIKQLSKKLNLKVIYLPFAKVDFYCDGPKEYEVGPKEFLELIKDAELICTDSYHGTIFSINFNRNFLSFLRFKSTDELCQNSRVENFLKRVKLQERIVRNFKNFNYSDIDWSSVNEILDRERKKSLEFLKEALEREV